MDADFASMHARTHVRTHARTHAHTWFDESVTGKGYMVMWMGSIYGVH